MAVLYADNLLVGANTTVGVISENLVGFQLKRPPAIPDRVDAAIIRLHSRRVTNMEFHPSRDNIVISGDKVISMLLAFCFL